MNRNSSTVTSFVSQPKEPLWTMEIVAFGKYYYNLGRSSTYAAANRGEIPVMRLGKKIVGLPRIAEAQLSGLPTVSVKKIVPFKKRRRKPKR